jgi:predicted dehydrogenase
VTAALGTGRPPLRVAICSAAHLHFRSYARILAAHSRVHVVGITDTDMARGRAAARDIDVPFVERAEDLLSRADAVVVTSENVHHRLYVEMAARAGMAILCEKPLATRIEDADAMMRAAEEGGARLYTALPVRGLPAVGRVRALVQGGALGRVLALMGTNHGRLPPGWFLDPGLAGGGAVMDHVSHIADIMRWVLNDDVVSVYAETSHRLHRRAVEDAALIHLTFRRGAVAALDPSWSRPASFPTWGDATLQVVGTDGVADLDAWAERLDMFPPDAAPPRSLGYSPDMDVLMLNRFVAAASGGPAALELATGSDGRAVLAITVAAYQSAASRAPVAVPP